MCEDCDKKSRSFGLPEEQVSGHTKARWSAVRLAMRWPPLDLSTIRFCLVRQPVQAEADRPLRRRRGLQVWRVWQGAPRSDQRQAQGEHQHHSLVCSPRPLPSFRPSVRPSVRPPVRPPVRPSVRPSVCLSVCLRSGALCDVVATTAHSAVRSATPSQPTTAFR